MTKAATARAAMLGCHDITGVYDRGAFNLKQWVSFQVVLSR